MKKEKKVVRVYELSEAIHNEDLGYNNSDLEYIDLNEVQFVLKEYLELDGNKVPTGRTFQINDLVKIINKEKLKRQMTATVSHNGQTGTFTYQFSLGENGNLKSDKFSNIETKEITIVLPGNIVNNNMFNEQITQLEEALVDDVARKANKFTKLKLQREYKFKKVVGKVAITAATVAVIGGVIAASPTLISAVQRQQAMQRQKEIEMLKQLGPTTSELQQQDDYEQLDTWDIYLKQQVEEQQSQRKLP